MNDVRRPVLLACGLLLPAVAWAQSSGSSLKGTTERIQDYYQQRQQVEPMPAAADPVQEVLPQTAPVATSAQQVRVSLRKLSFGPSELLDASELSAIAARYEGREVGMDDLQALVAEVNKAYADKGITTARARLGSQSIDDGEVHVDLVEGRLGQLSIAGERPVPEAFVRRRIQQQPGDVVHIDTLRDDLVYLNQTTSLDLRALLRAGQAPGLTDIVLNAQVPSKRSWGMFVDNAGIETSGRERIGVQGQFWGLAGMDDLLAGSVAYSDGGIEGRVSYSGLINRRNGRLEGSVARNRIDIIDGAYRELDITAESTNYALTYIQPWIATQAWSLTTSAGFSRLDSTTEISDERVADTESQVGNLGISVAYRNDRLQWTFSQGVSRVKTEVSTGKQPGFTIASGATGVTTRLGASGLVLRGQLGWQWSNTDDIGASQLFQVGGIGSVRGYVRGVLSAPKGYFANLELHRPYRERHDVYLFVDHGEVKGGQPETKTIDSVGFGLSGRFGKRLNYSLDVGHALDDVIADQDDYRADFRIGMAWQ